MGPIQGYLLHVHFLQPPEQSIFMPPSATWHTVISFQEAESAGHKEVSVPYFILCEWGDHQVTSATDQELSPQYPHGHGACRNDFPRDGRCFCRCFPEKIEVLSIS